jgi:hypothetical protein
LADDLRGHSATGSTAGTAAAARAAEAATTAARSTTTAEATTVTAAETAAIATTAETVATPAKAISTAPEAITAARERIETFLSETVPLVASPTATTSVKTHVVDYTFASPHTIPPAARTNRAEGQGSNRAEPAQSFLCIL